MQQLNRTIPPTSVAPAHISLKELTTDALANGLPLHYLNSPESDVLKLDFVFNAGLRNQQMPGIASAVSALLTEGTTKYTAKQLADNLDQFGAYVQAKTTADDATITLYCLPKFLAKCFPYVIDIITDCTFPENEIDTYKQNAVQRFLINNQRNNFMGRRAFYETIFGKDNAYGQAVNQHDYESISRETLVQFYTQNYKSGCKYILATGHISSQVLAELNTTVGLLSLSKNDFQAITIAGHTPTKHIMNNPFAVQSSIRIGGPTVNRKHPDFHKLQLLNLTLGGYFGSRLMKNIREEKGLTYGIHSGIESYWDAAAFYVETEMNTELRDKGIEEIQKEIIRLQTEPIPEGELQLVKNYMLGSFMRGIDGPFALADRHKMLIDYGFTYQYFQNFVDTITHATAEELKQTAQQYWNISDLSTIVVGNKI
jgi:zinc protease